MLMAATVWWSIQRYRLTPSACSRSLMVSHLYLTRRLRQNEALPSAEIRMRLTVGVPDETASSLRTSLPCIYCFRFCPDPSACGPDRRRADRLSENEDGRTGG